MYDKPHCLFYLEFYHILHCSFYRILSLSTCLVAGYPKAWGHGTDNIQLVKNIGNKSMVDTMVFQTEIARQLNPNKGVHVPHSGINISSERPREVRVPPVPS